MIDFLSHFQKITTKHVKIVKNSRFLFQNFLNSRSFSLNCPDFSRFHGFLATLFRVYIILKSILFSIWRHRRLQSFQPQKSILKNKKDFENVCFQKSFMLTIFNVFRQKTC